MAAGRPRKKKVRAADEPTDTSPQPRFRSLGTRSGDSGPLRGRFGAACRGSAIVGRARPRTQQLVAGGAILRSAKHLR